MWSSQRRRTPDMIPECQRWGRIDSPFDRVKVVAGGGGGAVHARCPPRRRRRARRHIGPAVALVLGWRIRRGDGPAEDWQPDRPVAIPGGRSGRADLCRPASPWRGRRRNHRRCCGLPLVQLTRNAARSGRGRCRRGPRGARSRDERLRDPVPHPAAGIAARQFAGAASGTAAGAGDAGAAAAKLRSLASITSSVAGSTSALSVLPPRSVTFSS